jgi:CheY-like chemotaxis protein
LLGIGCQVRPVASAAESFGAVRERVPDIVFMDVRMPVMNGADAARQLIAEHGPDRIKLVAMTASVLEHERVDHMSAGFHGFLSKPFRFPDVCACLKQLLGVEFQYGPTAPPLTAPLQELNPADCRLPLAVWEALKEAADRYSVTGLKKAIESLGGNRIAEYLLGLVHDGDLGRISTFLEQVKQKGGVR